MKPVEFKEQNFVFTRPCTMSDEECESLPCNFTNGLITSKWELDLVERQHCWEKGYIWLQIVGDGHPPVSLIAKPPEEVFVYGGEGI